MPRKQMSRAQIDEARRQHGMPRDPMVHVSIGASGMALLVGSLNLSLRTLRTDWDARAVPPEQRGVHASAMLDIHRLRAALVEMTRWRLGDAAWTIPSLDADWRDKAPAEWRAGRPRDDA